LIDLDNFKSINDRFGHAFGDRVLQVFAQTASLNIRPSDFIGRLGGEEFAAVLYNVGRERALVVAERMRAAFAEATAIIDGRPVAATASIGLVTSERMPLDLSDLLVQADQALYRAKERGRNRVEVAIADRLTRRSEGTNGPLKAKSAA
jgi:diguanylate cyclase (GGDEF)-like protein